MPGPDEIGRMEGASGRRSELEELLARLRAESLYGSEEIASDSCKDPNKTDPDPHEELSALRREELRRRMAGAES
jgi:hypothetical protein